MSSERTGLAARAAELRRAFDRSFSEPPRTDAIERVDLLVFRLGPDPYALALSDITGLYADKKIASLPSGVPALLGIAGFRGTVVPIYDARVLLGYPATGAPRWLVLASSRTPVGLAFDQFDGQLRVERRAISRGVAAAGEPRHVREVVHTDSGIKPIIHVASLVEAIGERVRLVPNKEP